MKNNTMKKLLTLAFAGAMTLSLAACGGKTTDDGSGAPQDDSADTATYKVTVIKQLDHARSTRSQTPSAPSSTSSPRTTA